MLANALCRTIWAWWFIYLCTKEYSDQRTKLFTWIGGGKKFELSLIELLGYGTVVICIYRTFDGKYDIFLNRLELIIQKLRREVRK